jgi:thioredoxin-dependent peroxiredoxin
MPFLKVPSQSAARIPVFGSAVLRLFVVGLAASSLLGCSRSPAKAEEPAPKSPETKSQAEPQPAPPSARLTRGSIAPAFAVTAHNGEKVSLESLRGKAVVLYFYPKDGTPGCTVEAQEFRNEYPSFQEKNAVILGVSGDDNSSHADFAEELKLPFLLLPDESGALRRAYGVGSFLGFSSRVTFVIDRAGQIAEIFPDVDPKRHAREILEVVSRI